LCCITINRYWDDIKGYECTHKVPLTQIFYLNEKLGESIYPFLNNVISWGDLIVLPGLNKNHCLTQKWLEIAFNKKMKPKEELDQLLYDWGDLKRANEAKLTSRILNMSYKMKPEEGKTEKNDGLVSKKKSSRMIIEEFNPHWDAINIIA